MNHEEVLRETDRLRREARVLAEHDRTAGAREVLGRLIALLAESLAVEETEDREPPTSIGEVARALSDAWGMLGGVERRVGDLDAALAAYENGRAVEQSGAYGIVDSYNLVNVLVIRVLRSPEQITIMHAEFVQAERVVARQVARERRDQWWAWADHGLLALLIGDDSTASRSYGQFLACRPRRANIGSVARVLMSLEDAVAGPAPGTAEDLAEVRARLEARAAVE